MNKTLRKIINEKALIFEKNTVYYNYMYINN